MSLAMDATGALPPPGQIGPLLHVVLYQPEIPQNTGNIGRTCVALGAKLWIVRPTSFRLDDANLKRAGLDYWQHLDWKVVDNWSALEEQLPIETAWLVTKFGEVTYTDASFQYGDILVIGRETSGLPESLRQSHPAHRQLQVPMPGRKLLASPRRVNEAPASPPPTNLPTSPLPSNVDPTTPTSNTPQSITVRSLNQATCTGIVMYEAYRQISSRATPRHTIEAHA